MFMEMDGISHDNHTDFNVHNLVGRREGKFRGIK